jgi:hypothetical protein
MGTTEIHVSMSVLRHDGFDFVSVSNHNDRSYSKGKKIVNDDDDI